MDECDRIKVLMHVHSFAYDFHLRSVHSYVSNDLAEEAKLCDGYHLTNFLDDFMKYYSKGPNYARNLVFSGKTFHYYPYFFCSNMFFFRILEIIPINNLKTNPKQLYDYLLSHEKHYHMTTYSMSGENEIINLAENEYVLVEVTSSPPFSYKDSQDRQHTGDLDITLIVSYYDGQPKINTENTLYLKYYLILTSRHEIYPKPEVERTLGKFRTVTSTSSNSEYPPKLRTRSPNTDSEINTSLAQEMIEDDSVTMEVTSVLTDSQSTDTDKADNFNLNEIFADFPPDNAALNIGSTEKDSKIPLTLQIR